MLRSLASIVVVASAITIAAPSAQAQPPAAVAAGDQSGEVTARGTARVYRSPDYLDVTIGAEIIETTAGEAYQKCASTMEAVLKALKELSLEAADFKTGSVDLSPRYERRDYEDRVPPKIIAYSATNTVRIRTSDLKAAPRIIDLALKSGANRVDGVDFGIRQVLEAREEALRLATRAAKRKAAVMAESLESRLGKLASISETTQQYYPWANRSNLAQVQAASEGGAAPGEDSIEPGQIEIVVDVVLTYTLRE